MLCMGDVASERDNAKLSAACERLRRANPNDRIIDVLELGVAKAIVETLRSFAAQATPFGSPCSLVHREVALSNGTRTTLVYPQALESLPDFDDSLTVGAFLAEVRKDMPMAF